MVRTGRLKKSVELVYWRPCPVIEATFGDHDVLLVGVVEFLVVIIIGIAGSNRNPLRVPFLLPFLAHLAATLDGAARLLLGTASSPLGVWTAPAAAS
jgi:hypothetical protein